MLQEFLQRLMSGGAPVQPMPNRLGLAPDMLEGPGASGPGMLAYHNALSSMSAPQPAPQPFALDAQGFPAAPEPYAAPQTAAMPQQAPMQPQQPLSRSGVSEAAPQSGGGIGSFLGNIFNPGGAQRNQTVQWLQSQGMDEGTATLMAGNKNALQSYLLDRSKGNSAKAALELAKLQLEVGNLANPRLSPAEEQRLRLDREKFGFEQEQAGVTPNIKDYQFYEQRERAAGREPLGPLEWEQAQRASGATTINNNMGGEAFADAFAKGDAAALGSVSEAGLSAQRNIGRIDRLGELLGTVPTGAEANFKQIAAEWGLSLGDDVDNIQAAQALINSLVPEQRPAGSGPMSDADLELFKQSLPRIINQPGGNEKILTTMKAIARYDAEGAVIVQRLRRGELDRAAAFEALQSRKNPFAGLGDISGASARSPRQPVTIDGYMIEQVD